jgi:pimeloyl-ACP methyl ester carboxylesterase
MFAALIELLADRYHLIAPDYPGFGHSDAPGPQAFAYTFDHLAAVVDGFTVALNLRRYVLFMQDYGGPVGFRLAMAHPERVQALVIQNAVAHEEGLGPLWEIRRAYWRDRGAYEEKLRANLTSLEAAKQRHLGTSPHPQRYDPDSWTDEYAFLSRPGEAAIQSDLFYDYRTNVDSYPLWQVSPMASISAQASAADARALGQIRYVVHRRWSDRLWPRRARCRNSYPRRRPFRHGRKIRRGCAFD